MATLLISSPVAAAENEAAAPKHWWVLSAAYKADVVGIARGGVEHGVRYLDNLNVMGDVDLDQAIGWKGATFHANVLNNFGGRPNDLAGSIQGVNNIEVQQRKLKLYEAWLEQSVGGDAVSLRAGLYDLNSEFYQSDATALLIAPPFGVGSELSATGPNGPSIFPSTALGARLRVKFGEAYVQAAVLNANAGTIGDDQGVDLAGREGALLIGEAGWKGSHGKIGIGFWGYTKRQPEIIPPGLSIGPSDHRSSGAYLISERDIVGEAGEPGHVRAFARLGISDGKTTPFKGGWQAGLLMDHVFARPSSALSLGAGAGYLARNYRDSNPVDAPPLRHSETILEATYSDELFHGFTVQPDVQYIIHPSADRTVRNPLVLGVRFQLSWSSQ